LQLPLKSITIGYRQEKARLVMELRESTDETVRDMEARVLTGRKWRAEEEVQKAVGRLQHQEMVVIVDGHRGSVAVAERSLGWRRGRADAAAGDDGGGVEHRHLGTVDHARVA